MGGGTVVKEEAKEKKGGKRGKGKRRCGSSEDRSE